MLFALLVLLAVTSKHNSGDWLACGSIVLIFGLSMIFEQETIPLFVPVMFLLISFVWAVILQPAILNHCHLPLWLLIFQAIHNCATIEQHATVGRGFLPACRAFIERCD